MRKLCIFVIFLSQYQIVLMINMPLSPYVDFAIISNVFSAYSNCLVAYFLGTWRVIASAVEGSRNMTVSYIYIVGPGSSMPIALLEPEHAITVGHY